MVTDPTTIDAAVLAAQAAESAAAAMFTANNIWMMLATALVFIMHLGFATVEAGLTRSKNSVNILFKNVFIICMGLLSYAAIGFNLMYPGDFNGWLGFAGFGLSLPEGGLTAGYAEGYTYWTDFIFQGMFAATAATIISGAVAERIKLGSFMVVALIYVTLIYPISGSWKWGGGWLDGLGFYDFAGSTLVHSVGGWAALVGAWMLGPRAGKYVEGHIKPIPGHSLPLATIGVMLLWLGWFGFNGGSVLSGEPGVTSYTLVTTSLAGAAGGLAAAFASWIVFRKPDLSMALNGILAGLVGITAGADSVSILAATAIGTIAGVLVLFSVLAFDKLRIDDPVGAISVHLVCGVWGTLAVGLFGNFDDPAVGTLSAQLIGVGAVAALSIISSLVIFGLVKLLMGLRVSGEEEWEGLDVGEHGMRAYADFQTAETR